MKRITIGCCIFLAVLLSATATLLAWCANHSENHRVADAPDWPKGLAGLINDGSRILGYFVNANDWFHYRGDAKAFNAFLRRYASLDGVPLTLVLHPGRGMTRGLGSQGPKKPFDWCLAVIRRGWGAEMPERYKDSPCKVIPTLSLYLGGNVGLEDLDVPLNVNVASSSRIERFVAQHEAKQSLVKKADLAKPAR